MNDSKVESFDVEAVEGRLEFGFWSDVWDWICEHVRIGVRGGC